MKYILNSLIIGSALLGVAFAATCAPAGFVGYTALGAALGLLLARATN
jgi:hypothetical protein